MKLRLKVIKRCALCRKIFRGKKYCSRECSNLSKLNSYVIDCLTCGNAFTVSASVLANGAKYCSMKCRCVATEDRHCAYCDEIFRVGYRPGLRHPQSLYCSKLCRYEVVSSRERIGNPNCAFLTVAQRAYISGLLDGEGYVGIISKPSGRIYVTVNITNTYIPVIDWLVEITGIGHINSRKPRSGKHKTAYSWTITGQICASLLNQIVEYTVIKRRQIDLALLAQNRFKQEKYLNDVSWQRKCVARMKYFNKRGPVAA